MESKEFQRLTINKMPFQSLDDPTIQFGMVMVITDVCKPTVGVMSRLMRAMSHCNVKPTLSSRFKLDRHLLKPRLTLDADSVSDESTRKSLSSGQAESDVLNLGCAGESLVMN